MTIGLLAKAGSTQARLLQQQLERLAPGAVHRFDLTLDETSRAVLNQDRLLWDGQPLDQLEALYVHGFSYQDPVVPPAEPECDWALWQAGAVIAQQKYSFIYSLLSRLEATACRLYNPVSAHLAAFSRFGLLNRLRQAGHAVAPLLLTNDDATVGQFLAQHPAVVWRPASGNARWQLFQLRQRQHLIGRERPPVLLAAVVPGPLVRAYVVNGQVVQLLGLSQPSCDGLEQLETAVSAPLEALPGWRELGPVLAGLGLRWGLASVAATAEGPVFYDVDPDPVLTDLPHGYRDHLIEALATGLLGRPLPETPAELAPQARPTLLLRRMLAIQFEMEATKYQSATAGQP